ncbi:conserved hypothetical protein [Leishmania infantum JPCM5]|uniref:Uncharacterized protein n=2 Tax=Leishmania infantum TaxID=5671 RepID=A4ICI7_LEIIN|nr:conserved hypothetical protein [Leishmania infantum JPCM5]CAC9550687.1 hypothetical_protein_-_conserved [Leishmania infantum]CAM72565.1 conserved hypothetical protein [Leishmania infantum JPCM5]SUZ46668.1 hypothetical_protein_-_conserved [Leishmania infantum]|eukprot:XP_001469456.1 conserved hypothetical protein [Leishmania infantum JPCM5]
MYSPYDAVYGHDATYIRRMTVEEYVQELKEEEADVRGVTPPLCAAGPASEKTASATPTSSAPVRRTTRQYEQRRMALSSCNPNVVFFSKYPMYDRLGRELCVAFQMQDMAVQQELRRLAKEDGRDSRRSGVRLSAELPMESDTTGGSRPMSVRASAATAEGHELTQTEEVSRVVRPSHIDGDTLVDIDVSATSHYPSVSAICTSSCPASARPSDFSIFRDSSGAAAARMSRGGPTKRHSCVPVRFVAEEEGILIHRSNGGGDSHRAASMPPAALPRLPDDADGRRSQWRWRSEKRHRSRSSGGGGRHSRVRFINDDQSAEDIQREEQPPQQRVHGALPLPPRLSTPPPMPLSEGDNTRVEETAVEDATRWTATSRASAAVRATKQLFRSITHTHTSTASRATATPSYRQPIASTAYGLSATAIAASKVGAAVEHNVQVCAAAMPPQLYSEEVAADVETTPELQCGSVVRLGSAWYRLVHFHLVAEVYVAVRISAPAQTAGSPIKTDRSPETGISVTVKETRAADSQAAPDQQPSGKELMVEAVTDTEPQQDRSVGAAAPELPMQPSVGDRGDRIVVASTAAPAGPVAEAERNYVPCTDDAESCPLPTSTDNACVGEASSQEYFVYRWRVTMLPRGGDEARRAALGLSLCAPAVHVHGIRYADGGGITVLSMPLGYRAVPMSGLPLSLRSYTTLMRVVLKAFSTMVARRTVHGNLSALGELFLAWPIVPEQSSLLPRVEEKKQRVEEGNANVGAQGATWQPFIMLFHWERWVDFSMFVDRNAGRTIPFDFEDGTAPSVITYGKDLLGSLQLFLEHPLAAELTSEQYILLQKLIVIASEPTQVANYLIQMKNLMLSLPTDTEALHQSFDAAVMRHAR